MSSETAGPGQVSETGSNAAQSFVRYRVIGLGFLAVVICYMDRTNMSVTIIPMAEQFGWNETTKGFVLSSFFFGYTGTQILGGWLADRFGGKRVLGAGVLLWSLFTVLTVPAAYSGIVVLIAARVAMGLGEGVTFPSVYSLFGRWTPPEEKSRAISLALSGTSFGSVAALLLTPPLIVAYGWEAAFYVFGLFGVVWWVAWHFLTSSSPEEHSGVSPGELALIRAGAEPETENLKVPIRAMLSHPAVWAIIIAYFCFNWSAFVMSAWLPTYVYEALGVDLAAVGLFAVAPAILGVIGMNAGGWTADWMLKRGYSVIAVRKTMNSVGFGINAAVLFAIGFVTSTPLAIAVFSIGAFFGGMAMAGCATNPLDIAPRYAGTLLGISNTIATIPGIVGVALSGAILDATGSWTLVFGIAGAFSVIGLIAFAALASGEVIFD